jgi:ligand-binding sensor domain-containing protein
MGNFSPILTEKEGLSNNVVWSIYEDLSGQLWFGTDGGVSKYNGNSFTHLLKMKVYRIIISGQSLKTVREISGLELMAEVSQNMTGILLPILPKRKACQIIMSGQLLKTAQE